MCYYIVIQNRAAHFDAFLGSIDTCPALTAVNLLLLDRSVRSLSFIRKDASLIF